MNEEINVLGKMLEGISKDASKYARKIMETIGEYSGKEAIGLALALEVIKEAVMKEGEITESLIKKLKESAKYNIEIERYEADGGICAD